MLSAVDIRECFFLPSAENALQQLMCNGFELRNLYIVCVSFETIESPIRQPIMHARWALSHCTRKEGNASREISDEERAAVVEHFDKKEEIVIVSHICSKGVACLSTL